MRPSILAPLALSGCIVTVTTFDERFDPEGEVDRVFVDVGTGSLELTTAADGTVRADVTVEHSGRPPILDVAVRDGLLRVTADCEPSLVCRTDWVVVVPEGVDVQVDAGTGDVDLVGPLGSVEVDQGTGDVSVHDAAGPVDLSLGTGRVTLEDIDGDVHVDKGTGAVLGAGLRSAVAVVDAGVGDVDLSFVSRPTTVDVDLGTGDVDLLVPAGDYAVDLDAGVGSESTTGLTVDPAADASITASTGVGDITLRGFAGAQ